MNTGIYSGVLNVVGLTVCTTVTVLVACFCMSQVGQAQEQGRQERPVKSGPEQIIRDLQKILKATDETSGAFDLRQVERVVAKEPVYQSKPKYCLVVFGQQ